MPVDDPHSSAPGRSTRTPLSSATLRPLALSLLTRRMGSAAGAEALAAAAHGAYADLARVSAPLIGQMGVDSLAGRALHLAQRDYAWLVPRREADPAQEPFAQVVFCLQRQDPAVAREAAAAVFAVYVGLLVTFIGDRLTAHLLRKAWPDAFSDQRGEERSKA